MTNLGTKILGGTLIAVNLPAAMVKTAVGKITRKKVEKKIEVTTKTVDIKDLPKETQDWMKRVYNKKNGIKETA